MTIFGALLFILNGFGEPVQEQDILLGADLGAYLRHLEENNPAIMEARHRWQAAVSMEDAAGAWPDPELGFGFFAQEVETRVGPQQWKLGISQGVPWPSKRKLERQIAASSALAFEAHFHDVRSQQLHAFKNHWAEYFYIGKSLDIAREHLVLLRDLAAVVDIKYSSGATTYANLIRMEVEIERMSYRIEAVEDMAVPVRASLNALLDRDIDARIGFPKSLAETAVMDDIDEVSLFEELRSHHPELLAMDHNIEEASAALALARKNRLPDFKVGIEWINTGDAIMSSVVDSGKDPLVLQFGVRLPINRKKSRAMERGAGERRQAIALRKENAVNQLHVQLKQAIFEHRESLRKIRLYRDTLIPKTRESLTVTLKGFESDQSGYLDVMDVERAYLELSLSLYRAMADRMRALATIARLCGEDNPPQPNKKNQSEG